MPYYTLSSFLSSRMNIISLWRKIRYRQLRRSQYKKLKKLKSFGHNDYICPGVSFSFADKISLSDDVWIGPHTKFDGMGGISIGRGCIISRNVEVLTSDHHFYGEDLEEIPYDKNFFVEPVVICENVWIGMRVVILPGVVVGEGAVIGACSVVTKDVPPCAIVAGNPAKVIRYRDKEQYYRLKDSGKIYLKLNYNYEVSPERLK